MEIASRYIKSLKICAESSVKNNETELNDRSWIKLISEPIFNKYKINISYVKI